MGASLRCTYVCHAKHDMLTKKKLTVVQYLLTLSHNYNISVGYISADISVFTNDLI